MDDREKTSAAAKRLLSASDPVLLAMLGNQRGIRQASKKYQQTGAALSQVFLSYARPDQAIVSSLYERLEKDGFVPWMDVKSLLPGQKWRLAILRAIRASQFFIVCLSSNSINRRGFLQREIRLALDALNELLDDDVYLIPVRLEACDPPDALRELHWVDLFERDGYDRLIFALRFGREQRNKNHP